MRNLKGWIRKNHPILPQSRLTIYVIFWSAEHVQNITCAPGERDKPILQTQTLHVFTYIGLVNVGISSIHGATGKWSSCNGLKSHFSVLPRLQQNSKHPLAQGPFAPPLLSDHPVAPTRPGSGGVPKAPVHLPLHSVQFSLPQNNAGLERVLARKTWIVGGALRTSRR